MRFDQVIEKKRKVFVIKLEKDFGRNFVTFVNLLDTFCCFYCFTFFINAQVRLSTRSKEASTQKLLVLNKRLGNQSFMIVMDNSFR